jgi:hypothetical protein
MTEAEQARWRALPAEEQLRRLRAAISEGMQSPPNPATMDDLWQQALARRPDAKL